MKEVIDFSEFSLILETNKYVVVDFYATWCGPCKKIAPRLQELSESHRDVKFVKVDVDKQEELASKYRVSAMPTFLFFAKGKKVDEVVGANLESIKDKLNKLKTL
jgi:thioredoxin 1